MFFLFFRYIAGNNHHNWLPGVETTNQYNYGGSINRVPLKLNVCNDFNLARFKIGARGLSEISRIYGTVRLGNVFSLVRTVVRLVWWVRLVPFVGTLEPYQPHPEAVPVNCTTVPYQIGVAFWMYQYYLDPPLNLVRYGGTVYWYGRYGRYGW